MSCVNLFTYAKSIRVEGEDWKACIKRASAEVKAKGLVLCRPVAKGPRKQRKFAGKTKSECYGLVEADCQVPCGWVKATTTKAGKVRKAHCGLKRVGAKRMTKKAFKAEMPF